MNNTGVILKNVLIRTICFVILFHFIMRMASLMETILISLSLIFSSECVNNKQIPIEIKPILIIIVSTVSLVAFLLFNDEGISNAVRLSAISYATALICSIINLGIDKYKRRNRS